MEYDYSGEKFLERLFKDLYLSEEVQHTSKKGERKGVAIKKYMDRLERIHKLANTEEKKEILKQFYYRKYVIKENNIPSGLNKKEIIEAQKKRLSMWIDYLTDENAKYPIWAKYWAFQGMLKLGTFDEVRGVYQRRTEKTIAPFVEANPEVIAFCIDNMVNYVKSKQIENVEVKPMLETGSFKKLYEYYVKKYKDGIKRNESNKGIWVKYNEGNKDDAIRLSKSLENKATGWCTASEGTAINQVCGGGAYPGGDFFVYYTLDENGEYKNPRIAIRMEGKTSIGEIRGIAENQNLEEEMTDILEVKLKEMTFIKKEDIEKNLEIVNDLRELYQMYKKTVLKQELSAEELISLYTKKYGFGWQNDPTAVKIINSYRISNKDILLKVLKQNGSALQYASEELKGDKEVVLEAVKQNGTALEHAIEGLKGDKEVVLEAVKQSGYSFRYANKELREDKEVVLEAVKQSGSALQYAIEGLKGDKEVVLEAVKQSGYCFRYANKELREDKEVVLEAVKQSGSALQYASEELKRDKEVVLEAVKQNGSVLQYASEELKRDKEVVLEAVKQYGDYFRYASKELKEDKKFVLEVVKLNGSALEYASEELKRDKEVVLEAVKQSGSALEYASEELKGDKEEVLEAVKQSGSALQYASEELKRDKEVVLEAVKQYGDYFRYASKELREDKEVVLEAVKQSGSALEHASEELQKDKEFVLEAVKQSGYSFRYASEELKRDKEVVLEAVKQSGSALEHASEELKKDKEVVLEAVKQNGYALHCASNELRNDKEVVLEAVKQDGESLEYASEELKKDKEFFLMCIHTNTDFFKEIKKEIDEYFASGEESDYIDDFAKYLIDNYEIIKQELNKMIKSKFKDIKSDEKVDNNYLDDAVLDMEESEEVAIKR